MFFNVPAPPDISQTCPTRSLQDALPTSAYALRLRRDGAAVRLGWDAAILIARARLADDLLARALTGHEEVIRKDMDAGEITRHRHDNRLAMSMLSRLDRMADSPPQGSDAEIGRASCRERVCQSV